jgi:hypothetical protein
VTHTPRETLTRSGPELVNWLQDVFDRRALDNRANVISSSHRGTHLVNRQDLPKRRLMLIRSHTRSAHRIISLSDLDSLTHPRRSRFSMMTKRRRSPNHLECGAESRRAKISLLIVEQKALNAHSMLVRLSYLTPLLLHRLGSGAQWPNSAFGAPGQGPITRYRTPTAQ